MLNKHNPTTFSLLNEIANKLCIIPFLTYETTFTKCIVLPSINKRLTKKIPKVQKYKSYVN